MTTTATTATTATPATSGLDTAALVSAIVGRDAETLSGLYAADATVSILDRDHAPAGPQVLSGRAEIEAYFRDICGRNIEHTVPQLVADRHGVAFEQHCRYPEGNRVVCVTVARVERGLITSQTIVQAWD